MNSSPSVQIEKKVYLAGEGNNELGSWARGVPYQDGSTPGVLETLLKKVKDSGWQVVYGKKWKDIHKYKADENQDEDDLKGDEQSVYRACLEAEENGFNILAFSRDIDGRQKTHLKRMSDMEKGLSRAQTDFPSIGIIGGCARPTIEGWVLAFSGVRRTETFSKDKANTMLIDKLSEKGITSQQTQDLVDFIKLYDRTGVADDAECLNLWLNKAKDIL